MGGREQNAVSGGKEITAGRAPFAGADEFRYGRFSIRGIHRDGVNLIARHIASLVLEYQLFVIKGEIGLSVLAPKGELSSIFQMLLFFGQEGGIERSRLSMYKHVSQAIETKQRENSCDAQPRPIAFSHDVPKCSAFNSGNSLA